MILNQRLNGLPLQACCGDKIRMRFGVHLNAIKIRGLPLIQASRFVGEEHQQRLVPGLFDLINELHKDKDESMRLFLMEFALHGLAEYSLISKHTLSAGLQFKDLLSSMFSLPTQDDEDEPDDEADFGSKP